MKVEIRHLTRVEGHAHLVVDTDRGELRECRLEIIESPRFFESLLKGRHYSDVAPIAARICGVCSTSHTLVSLGATEQALGVAVTPQTLNLRRLLTYGEIFQSHILQLYFMAAPDYLGVSSLFPLVQTHSQRDLVLRALRLKKIGNDICAVIGGRPVHPITPCVGGFSALPAAGDLQSLRKRLVECLPDLEATVELFSDFPIPQFERETEYVSLDGSVRYPCMGETLVSTFGLDIPVTNYESTISEYVVPHSTAKFARTKNGNFSVGPLARFKNGGKHLSEMATKVAKAVGLKQNMCNPYHGILARLVETIHCAEESIHLIDTILLSGLSEEPLQLPRRSGVGTAAMEAPRGTLYHSYTYDKNGCIEKANCIIPTAQNLASIEEDLKALVPELAGHSEDEMRKEMEMLIRAYDPCISCSTHLLKVDFC